MKTVLLITGAALLLTGCANPLASQFVSAKIQAAGVNYGPATGMTAGYASITGHFTPAFSPDGKTPLQVAQPCGQTDMVATYSNLNAKANATASSVGTKAAPGVDAPAIAWASGDTAATGAAARMLAVGGGLAPTPEALAAYQDSCQGNGLPSATGGSIVAHGVAPSPAASK